MSAVLHMFNTPKTAQRVGRIFALMNPGSKYEERPYLCVTLPGGPNHNFREVVTLEEAQYFAGCPLLALVPSDSWEPESERVMLYLQGLIRRPT